MFVDSDEEEESSSKKGNNGKEKKKIERDRNGSGGLGDFGEFAYRADNATEIGK